MCDKLTCKLKCNDNDNDVEEEKEEEMVTLKTPLRATFIFQIQIDLSHILTYNSSTITNAIKIIKNAIFIFPHELKLKYLY